LTTVVSIDGTQVGERRELFGDELVGGRRGSGDEVRQAEVPPE